MAYLRSEKEALEIDFALEDIWEAIPKAVAELTWKIEESDPNNHHLKIRSKKGFFAYPTLLTVDLSKVNYRTTKMVTLGETPVTTITAVADYGRTRERIEQFIETVAKILKTQYESKPAPDDDA